MENQVSVKTMKAVRFHDYGNPDKLKLENADTPLPKDNEVLIQIHAVAVNPFDWKARAGIYKQMFSVEFPSIPGIEASGTIKLLGSSVKKFKIGDAVYGSIRNSTAEFAIANPQHIYLKPTHLSFEEAAAIPVASQTAYSSLFDTAGLKKGEKILIQGAAGSVGVFAVQLAKWKGAYVIGTASQENIRFVKSLGADEVIDYQTKRFEDYLKNLDVVFDSIGGDVQERSMMVLKRGGRLVSIVGQPSEELAKKYGIKAMSRNSGISPQGIKDIQMLIENKTLMPFIREVLPIEKAAEAHEKSQLLHGRGKIVLKVF